MTFPDKSARFSVNRSLVPVRDSASRIGYPEVVPLRMPLRVEIASQVELVIRVGYFHHLAEVPGLEPRLESQVRAVVLRPGRLGDEEDIVPVGGRLPRKTHGVRRATAHARSAKLRR